MIRHLRIFGYQLIFFLCFASLRQGDHSSVDLAEFMDFNGA
jgi:hypothetical protein